MSDFRDFLPTLFDLYRQLTKLKTSVQYQRVRASGSNHAEVSFQKGRLESFHLWDDLTVDLFVAEKKNTQWGISSETCADFSAMTEWNDYVTRRLSTAASGNDPRPPFAENPVIEECPAYLLHYDPEIAQMLSPVIFHRIYQTTKNILQKGFVFDCHAHWSHGGISWQNQPLPFCWVDSNAFYFAPQTQIDETITIWHPDYPQLKRTLISSVYRLSDTMHLDDLCDELISVQNSPFYAWNRKNIDHIVLMPGAAAKLLGAFLNESLQSPETLKVSASHLSSFLVLMDTPDAPVFGRSYLVDANGHLAKSIVMVQGSQAEEIPSSQNGHAPASENDSLQVYCPMLAAAQADDEEIEITPQKISEAMAGRILIVEDIRVVTLGPKERHVLFPKGGVLYREGRCLGYVAPIAAPMDLHSLIKSAHPVGKPVRIGGLATCALEFAP
ncbi:MAG: hypothetical protein J6A01_05675 [Proteobacteria bacterium]|nr:hypothetical protein [Pseudomonadota bacterium]